MHFEKRLQATRKICSPPLASFSSSSSEVGKMGDQGDKLQFPRLLFPSRSCAQSPAPLGPSHFQHPTSQPFPSQSPGCRQCPPRRQGMPSSSRPRPRVCLLCSALLYLASLHSLCCPPLAFAFLLFTTLPLHPSPLYPSLSTSPFAPLSFTSLPFAFLPPSHLCLFPSLPFASPLLTSRSLCTPCPFAPDPLHLCLFALLPSWISALRASYYWHPPRTPLPPLYTPSLSFPCPFASRCLPAFLHPFGSLPHPHPVPRRLRGSQQRVRAARDASSAEAAAAAGAGVGAGAGGSGGRRRGLPAAGGVAAAQRGLPRRAGGDHRLRAGAGAAPRPLRRVQLPALAERTPLRPPARSGGALLFGRDRAAVRSGVGQHAGGARRLPPQPHRPRLLLLPLAHRHAGLRLLFLPPVSPGMGGDPGHGGRGRIGNPTPGHLRARADARLPRPGRVRSVPPPLSPQRRLL